jgi:hypothetical protein
MKPYNPIVYTCIIRLSHATANFMQLVVCNWANFQLHVSHATGNQLHKTVAKCQISSSEGTSKRVCSTSPSQRAKGGGVGSLHSSPNTRTS